MTFYKLTFAQISAAFVVAICTGCHPVYLPPADAGVIKSEEVVDRPKAAVFQNVIENLSKSFFVINNINLQVGFINVSYAGDPENYVNCGHVSFHNATESLEFDVASNTTPVPSARRNIRMSSSANIFIKSLSDKQSSIFVNVNYAIFQDYMAESLDGLFGTNRNQQTESKFATNETGRLGSFDCRSTGILEHMILATAH